MPETTRNIVANRRQTLAPEVPLGEFYLLVIGIGAYRHCPCLDKASHDARELIRVLHNSYGFTSERTVVLLDQQATRKAILQALRNLARSLSPDDHLLVAFFGHGNLDDVTNRGSWIPVEGREDEPDGWVPNSEIKDLVAAMKARHVLVVSDSCFSGDLLVYRRLESLMVIDDAYARKAFPIKSRQALTSGRRELVVDGMFGPHLVRHLEESREAWLVASDLFDRVKRGVAANATQVPQFGTLLHTDGDLGGEFVLFRQGAAQPPDEVEPPAAPVPAVAPARAGESEVRARLGQFVRKRSAQWAPDEWRQWLLDQHDEGSITGWKRQDVERLLGEEKQRWLEALAEEGVRAREEALRQPPPATRERPWENSLGMKFVPVPGTEVLFSIWETRVQDYELFAQATKRSWNKPSFEQGPTHPAVNVNWEDAQAFCQWLTEKEKGEGRLTAQQSYRLPTDEEWSGAVGLPEEPGKTPEERSMDIQGVYPWGTQWPPPKGAGNYCDETYHQSHKDRSYLQGYDDGYEYTSPVGSFTVNACGLYDMGGNVLEWCEDWYSAEQKGRVLRGASCLNDNADDLLSSYRNYFTPDFRINFIGFRVVLAGGMSR